MIRKSTLLFFEGTYETFENDLNALSRVYMITVPKGQVWELDPSRPFVMYLLAKDEGLTPSAETNGTVTTSHNILVPTRANGEGVPVGRYEVLVGTVGGNKTRLTVAARGTNSLQFSGTIDAGTKVDAYYIPDAAAMIQFRVEDPRYMVTLDTVTMAEDPSVLMRPNPFKNTTMYHLSTSMVIPSDFILSLWLKAPYRVAWEDSAGQRLPVLMQLPIIIYSQWQLPEDLELKVMETLARGG